MDRRRFLGALTAVSVGAALDGSLPQVSLAQNAATGTAEKPSRAGKTSKYPPDSTVILVHGAWADGSCWRNIILPLEQSGLQVICAPIPMTSLSNDTMALSRVLERTSGPLVLVGHAYSGAVIAAVRNDRIKSLVYISALAPDEGETVAKVFYMNPSSLEAPKMVPDSHGDIWLPKGAFHNALAQNASQKEADIAAAVQRPIALPCIQQPAPTPLWRSKPSWYLVADEDRMINPKTQHFMAQRMGATVRPHRVDHTSMYSNPGVVIEVIQEAAQKTLSS